jgi:hypothetical protein
MASYFDNETKLNLEARETLQELARKILKLDPCVLGCQIVANPGGAVIVDLGSAQLSEKGAGKLEHVGSGMGPLWGIVAVNALRRFDSERSRMLYFTVVREKYEALILPLPENEDFVVGIELVRYSDAWQIYNLVLDSMKAYHKGAITEKNANDSEPVRKIKSLES